MRFKPYNLDVLPLYIVLMAFCPFLLWVMLRRPGLTILGSLVLYSLLVITAGILPRTPKVAGFSTPSVGN